MELKKKFLIKKVLSILCLIVVVLLFFCGWINVRSSYHKEKFRSEIKEWEAKIDEYSRAAEPPVRCGGSHYSGLAEPPFIYSYCI